MRAPQCPPVQTDGDFAALRRRPACGPPQPPACAGGFVGPRCHGNSERKETPRERHTPVVSTGCLRRGYLGKEEAGVTGSGTHGQDWGGTGRRRDAAAQMLDDLNYGVMVYKAREQRRISQ